VLYGTNIKPSRPDNQEQPQRIELPEGSHRGGLLGMSAVLAVSSHPHRTSPVLRGKWLLEAILGTPPPPPPPNVPKLDDVKPGDAPATLRERLAQHREDPVCAGCHSRIDPLGFALENYDVLGRWRTEDAGKPIDASGKLPDGTVFEGPDELGLRDLATHVTTVRDTYPRVKAKGYHVIYREFEDMGSRSYYPPSNDDSIAWATRLRNKNIAPSAGELSILRTYSSGAAPAITDGYFPGLALVGGAPAGEVLKKLFLAEDANVRAAAAETGSHGLFGEGAVIAMVQLIGDSSPKVRQAAIRALGMNANWRSQAAQQALIQLATNKSADLSDRLSATDALGYAVRLQVRAFVRIRRCFRR
jgi:hypothetical protein